MTINYLGSGFYSGLSTDTKPTGAATNTVFIETDTRWIYTYSGSAWVIQRPNPNPTAMGRKYGLLTGFVATPLSPLGAAITGGVGQASAVSQVPTQAMGRFITYTTGTTAGNNAGGHVGSMFMRAHNPYLAWKGRTTTTQTTGSLTSRFFLGISSDAANSPAASDTYADGKSVFLFGYRSTDTNFQIIRNDASTPATYVDTGLAIGSTLRTVELIGDDANTRFGWRINGGAVTWYTTAIPAQTTNLGLVWEIQTTDTTAKAFDLESLYTEFDSP